MLGPILPLLLALPGAGDATPSDQGTWNQGTWNQWRGPTRDGQFQGTAWPDTLTENNLVRSWRIELGSSYSGPLVTGDKVITTASVDSGDEIVRAVDRRTGEMLWEASWKGSMKVPFFAARNGSWIRSTPALDGDHLYVAGMRDVLVCLDVDTGEKQWAVDFKERFGTSVPSFGFASSPLVLEDGLVVQAGASLVKLDKETGETIWRSLEDRRGSHESPFSSPMPVVLHGRSQLLTLTRQAMHGVDPDTGRSLWNQPIKATRGMNILTPIADGNTVFTSAYGGRAQLLDVREAEGAFEVETRWQTGAQGYMTSPLLFEGHAYLFLRSNRFTCIRLEDGESRWTSPPTGDEYWSLVGQGDRILALANTGRVRLIQATPEDYRVLGEVQVSESETWAHLAVAGDELFIREIDGLSAWRWSERAQ